MQALLNEDILRYHQSTATHPGRLVASGKAGSDMCVGCQVWARDVLTDAGKNGTLLVVVNWGGQHAEDISYDLASHHHGQGGPEGRSQAADAFAAGDIAVTDLWAHVDAPANVEVSAGGVVSVGQVPPGGCEILLLS